ncbi:hypothetical protein LLH06_10090 [Mucilaginibacter daejeonensis]|uniref:hypothetical protein n=1 Tax=Mucilaginibacter daejeonensis TaxID=398049 RepID=UPI001D17C1DD|nr:hypothetical protein [Mucilaginibacter daejeonensis]UEG55309.1 hypothetical protein LLH06_10090 [Mucilaginibacter daejeonensis]
MATLKTTAPAANWILNDTADAQETNLWTRLASFADGQKQNHTLWFFVILVVHGVLFLPLPAVLMYYFDAPAAVLAITMVCFFTNLIANMGGAGIRAALALFGVSVLLHLAMALIFII